jgi:hypothetical protein
MVLIPYKDRWFPAFSFFAKTFAILYRIIIFAMILIMHEIQ